jgi:peptide/nickel transport system substrate-binding protein
MITRRSFGALASSFPIGLAILPAQAATPTDTLVIAKQIDDLLTLDPGECYESSGVEVDTNLYDRILRYEPEDLTKLVGGVAESWTVSQDGKNYTFKIRPGLKFQSGAPVTAEDAAWSLQRVAILNKTSGFLVTQLGWTKDNVRDLVKSSGDTLTFTITQDFAPSLVLNLMTSVVASVIERSVAMSHEVNGDLGNGWLKTNSASSGAFRLVSWKSNESVTMEAYSGFRMGSPRIKRVVLRHIPEAGTQRLLLEKGDIDIARDLTPDQLAPIADNKDIRIDRFTGANNWLVYMNTAVEPLGNVKVRTALKMLVDYQGMVNSLLKDRFFVQQTFLPLGYFGAITYNPFKLDIAGAKKLLAEAGYPNGFEIKLTVKNSSPEVDIAQSIQQTMGQAGVKMTVNQVDQKQLLAEHRARKHQMVLYQWSPDYFDPHSTADWFTHNDDNSENTKMRLAAWRQSWLIPELTNNTMAASRELDMTKRAAMYAELQRTVTDEGPYIFMFQNKFAIASRANVTGFNPGIIEDLFFYRTIRK